MAAGDRDAALPFGRVLAQGFARRVANRTIFMRAGLVWEVGGAEMFAAPRTPELQQFLGSEL